MKIYVLSTCARFFLITVDDNLKVEHKLESVIQFGTNIDESQQYLYKPILNVLRKKFKT